MTKVLVVHGSKLGGTAEIAEWVGADLREVADLDVDVMPAAASVDVTAYDGVVIGGALYAGRWHRDARRFARSNAGKLSHLPVWAFSSGPLDRSAEEGIQPTRSVHKIIQRVGVRDHATFGGRLEPDAKGFMVSSLAKSSGGDYRDRRQIRDWALGIAKELEAVDR
ncbi:flavodoxin domain-containing protein [Spirillospora sp. NPDC047279]|uniref:flavodoxin domain-containing protein n=1 Tax=Spirillospora sp. NPDC047279 TaxID=3155478 RepID=UPI0033FABDE1